MDPLTHWTAAWLLAKRLRMDLPYAKLLIFSALLPDIDIFLILLGAQYESVHAVYTHTLPGIIGLGIPVLLVFRFLYKIGFARAIPVYLLGFGSHLFLDMFNWRYAVGYSQRFLWPWSTQTFNLWHLLEIPSYASIAFAVYVSIFLLALAGILYSIWKKEYPWMLGKQELLKV